MKKAIGCSAQLILLLGVAALLAAPLACIATATAPMHSPQLAEKFICPPNTHIRAEWYRATWNEPGEQTLSVVCVDAQGNNVSTLPEDTSFWISGLETYFPYAFIPLLVIGAVILAGMNALGIAIVRLWKRQKNQNERRQ